MPGPWFTGTQVLSVIANRLSGSTVGPKWAQIANEAADTAYTDLRNILAAKGYTSAQMDAWDDRATYSKDQAMFWAYTNAGELVRADEKIDRLDRREELRNTGAIMISGVLTPPGADPATGVGAGSLTTDPGGVDYGTTFGTKSARRGGNNQYGDPLWNW